MERALLQLHAARQIGSAQANLLAPSYSPRVARLAGKTRFSELALRFSDPALRSARFTVSEAI